MSAMGFIATRRFWTYLGGAMLASLLVLAIASVVFVQQAGGLSPLVERQLNKVSDQIVVRVSDAGLDLQWSSRPVVLKT